MAMFASEVYTPLPLAANFDGLISSASCILGGFVCTTAGTLVLRATGSGGAVMVASMAVAAGGYYPLPFAMPSGAYITLGGGAAGTLAWSS